MVPVSGWVAVVVVVRHSLSRLWASYSSSHSASRAVRPRRGDAQTAYRVLVALHSDGLDDDRLLWDSGRVEGDDSLHVEYDGSRCSPRPATTGGWPFGTPTDRQGAGPSPGSRPACCTPTTGSRAGSAAIPRRSPRWTRRRTTTAGRRPQRTDAPPAALRASAPGLRPCGVYRWRLGATNWYDRGAATMLSLTFPDHL